ncbi:hypothetical protein OEZ86_003479 [Tetradesmus obliquus]|nr:hypothetical protein OEZ86_003479 [Tetradesmus obliquus]
MQEAVARSQQTVEGGNSNSAQQQQQQQVQQQLQQQGQQQQQEASVQPSGQYTADPDCRGPLARTNPNCGFWPWPKPRRSPRPGGGGGGTPGPLPPGTPPAPPPPPDGNGGGDGVFSVLANNLVGDTDACEPAGIRSLGINVKSNVMTLPGVRAASLVVDVTCTPGQGGSGARYLARISYSGTPDAKAWLDTAIPRLSPCCLWELLCASFRSATSRRQRISDAKFCKTSTDTGCSSGGGGTCPPPSPCPAGPPGSSPCPRPPPPPPCPRCPPSGPTTRSPPPPPPRACPSPSPCPACSCAPPPPPPPPPPPRTPPPPISQQCTDYLSTTANNLVVWGDGRDPANAVWTVNPAGQGSCQSSPVRVRVYPTQAACTQATSLAIEVTGLVFMQCFTYDVLSSVPIVGPEVLLEPTGFRGELRLTQLQFDIVAPVEDCTQLLTLNVQNSRGVTRSITLPCIPDNTQPYDFPPGTILYPDARQRVFFTGMSNQHVISVRRIYYEVTLFG